MIHSILWVGPRSLPEFSRIAAQLHAHFPVQFLDQLSEVDIKVRADFVVLAQSRPGLFLRADVDSLRGNWPTARFVSLSGSWCEGEPRTGSPLIGVARLYAHQWPDDPRLLEQLVDGSGGSRLNARRQPLVVIQVKSSDYAAALADALAAVGCRTIEVNAGHRPRILRGDFVIWDVPLESDRREDELAELRKCMPHARVVALCTFPRDYEIQALLAAGAEQVISQPFQLEQLTHAVLQASQHEAFHSAA